MAVAFYDRRQACPTADPSISPESRGRENVCIDVTLQVFKDGAGAVRVGGNVRFTAFTWDREQPVQTIDGLDQMACAAHENRMTRAFIGDYFGLAISAGNVYGFFVDALSLGRHRRPGNPGALPAAGARDGLAGRARHLGNRRGVGGLPRTRRVPADEPGSRLGAASRCPSSRWVSCLRRRRLSRTRVEKPKG